MYSRRNQVNLCKTAFKKLELIWSAEVDRITANFLKTLFLKFYLTILEHIDSFNQVECFSQTTSRWLSFWKKISISVILNSGMVKTSPVFWHISFAQWNLLSCIRVCCKPANHIPSDVSSPCEWIYLGLSRFLLEKWLYISSELARKNLHSASRL